MMWPGANFHYQNRLPTFYQAFNDTVSWKWRVDEVLGWILNETTPVNLAYLYFEQPDEAGHHFGPDSPQVNDELRRINDIVVYLLQQLDKYAIRDKVNLFFLADHGMASVSSGQIIDLDKYLDSKTYTFCGTSPGLHILPNPGIEN